VCVSWQGFWRCGEWVSRIKRQSRWSGSAAVHQHSADYSPARVSQQQRRTSRQQTSETSWLRRCAFDTSGTRKRSLRSRRNIHHLEWQRHRDLIDRRKLWSLPATSSWVNFAPKFTHKCVFIDKFFLLLNEHFPTRRKISDKIFFDKFPTARNLGSCHRRFLPTTTPVTDDFFDKFTNTIALN